MKRFFLLVMIFVLVACAFDAFAMPPNFFFNIDIEAVVTDLGEDLWLYEYTLSQGDPEPGLANPRFKDLSHWWIELPEEKIGTLRVFDPGSVETYFKEKDGKEDGFDGFHYGVKWDSEELITYSFTSTHGPVLDENGQVVLDAYDWFAKSGQGYYDFGKTLGPNGGHHTPEPASLILLGTGLLGFGVVRRKK